MPKNLVNDWRYQRHHQPAQTFYVAPLLDLIGGRASSHPKEVGVNSPLLRPMKNWCDVCQDSVNERENGSEEV